MAYLLMTKKSIHIPGDERSKTHPGHGYPAHNETFECVEVILDEAKLKNKIKSLVDRKVEYTLYKGEEINVSVDTVVKLGN